MAISNLVNNFYSSRRRILQFNGDDTANAICNIKQFELSLSKTIIQLVNCDFLSRSDTTIVGPIAYL